MLIVKRRSMLIESRAQLLVQLSSMTFHLPLTNFVIGKWKPSVEVQTSF
jgi:hypothetical protein